ncbi:MAG: hypothetical protein ABI895_12690 [Deltaproteobacteria bacterium]
MQNTLLAMTGGALLLLGAVEGCDAQVDPGYQGEPLVTLKGRVEALQVGAPEADVGVLWLTSDPLAELTGQLHVVRHQDARATGADARALTAVFGWRPFMGVGKHF